jgi:hypothetical protein
MEVQGGFSLGLIVFVLITLWINSTMLLFGARF